jgi:molybdopterin converting factor small subunit
MGKERVFKRGSEKMTVVDTLQAAYARQDIPEEEKEYLRKFFNGEIDLTKLSKDEIEKFFSILREITDKVALMNSPYPSELDLAFTRLEEFWKGLSNISLELLPGDVRLLYISHLTFHRETVADIISEARELLIEERRNFLKRLVQYHREFTKWLQQIEKKYL